MSNQRSIFLLSFIITVFGALPMTIAQKQEAKLQPPVATKKPQQLTTHGDTRIDNYYWLRERTPEVINYLKAENQYTQRVMHHTQALQKQLYREFVAKIQETDLTVPEKIGDYYYYSRTEQGKQYPIYCRKKDNLQNEEQIILDQNQIAVGKKYCEIGVLRVSPNQKLLAFSLDDDGSETYTIFVKDLGSGKLMEEKIENTYYGLEWANDNTTFFYNTLDVAKRPYKLYRHRLGTDSRQDVLMYHESDESFFLDIGKSKSKSYLFLILQSQITSEVHYLPADTPEKKFRLIEARRQGIEYSVGHHGDKFYIVTNDNAKNFRLMQVETQNPVRPNWQTVLEHRAAVKIDSIDLFKRHLVVYERCNGLQQIRIVDLTTNKAHYVDFQEAVYSLWPGANKDFNSSLLRFNYTSLVTPKSVYDYDMKQRTRELKKRTPVPGYDPRQYYCERIFATANDNTKIPLSLVYKKDLRKGDSYVYLYGYGAYGLNEDPVFSSNRLSLLDRGFVYAIAHVRGGGEMGRQWYEDGKYLNKKNTFTDFIAAAEHLLDKKYTTKERLAISGGSAGGLLMGAVTNMRPDLWQVVVADVPFVDVVTTMLDESIPLTVTEFEEWGNPKQKAYYEYMKSYSPYDNVVAQDYPHMLVTAGLNDPRVQYWEPAKWVAKLRAMKTDNNRLLFKVNMGSGHSGASGRYDYLKEIAFEYAFILDCLQIRESNDLCQ